MTRMGGKKDPHYRVVVAERRGPRDGRFVESVGYYNPAMNPVRLNLDHGAGRLLDWKRRPAF